MTSPECKDALLPFRKVARRATGAGSAAWRAQDQIDGWLIDCNYDADLLVVIAPVVDLLIDPWLYAAFIPALFAFDLILIMVTSSLSFGKLDRNQGMERFD